MVCFPPPTLTETHAICGRDSTATILVAGSYVTLTPSSSYTSALSFGAAVASTATMSLRLSTSLRLSLRQLTSGLRQSDLTLYLEALALDLSHPSGHDDGIRAGVHGRPVFG